MLINGSRLKNCAILSLHVGGEIARVVEPIIDPDSLKIIAFRVEGAIIDEETGDILPTESIREFSRLGMIIDSIDELVNGAEVVHIKKILKLNFSLVGLKVVTKKQVKLGKVLDFVTDDSSWQIHQLVVQRPLMKSFVDPELLISRSKILTIDDYKVTVKDEREQVKKKQAASTSQNEFIPNFINPFREPDFAPETITKGPSS